MEETLNEELAPVVAPEETDEELAEDELDEDELDDL